MPTLSIPFEWENTPKETKQFVLVTEDYDAVEAVGVIWLHWLTLIPGDVNNLEENVRYGGPVPPNKTHTYAITIYALDKKLDLGN